MSLEWTIDEMPDRDLAVLRISGELDFDMRPEFQKAITDLVEKGCKKLVIDLSNISRMSSVFIGTLIDQGHSIQQNGKSLSVMLVDRIARICTDAGLDKVVHIIVVKGNA